MNRSENVPELSLFVVGFMLTAYFLMLLFFWGKKCYLVLSSFSQGQSFLEIGVTLAILQFFNNEPDICVKRIAILYLMI